MHVTLTPVPVSPTPIRDNLKERAQSIEQQLSKLVNEFLDQLLSGSRKRVPVQHGDLKRSGVKIKERGELEGYVIYGGPQAPQAAYVHEILHYHHDQGEAKYLENELEELRPEFIQRVAALLGSSDFSVEFRMLTRAEEEDYK